MTSARSAVTVVAISAACSAAAITAWCRSRSPTRLGWDASSPADFRREYASALIQTAESVNTVRRRLGHASAATTLDVYSHLWPDSDERSRTAIEAFLGAPADSTRTVEA